MVVSADTTNQAPQGVDRLNDLLGEDIVAAIGACIGAKHVVLGKRRRNGYASTWTTEIVECAIDGAPKISVFLKWSDGTEATESYSLEQSRIAYEASVYASILEFADLGTAKFYGSSPVTAGGRSLLVIEHLTEGVRLKETPNPKETLIAAAAWAGRFHALHTGHSVESLVTHDAQYFAGWFERTANFVAPLAHEYPPLGRLAEASEVIADALCGLGRTVIHGEFTPQNVLAVGSRITPVDWESTAISAGEIDLIGLVDGWPQDVVLACEEAYVRARWPDGIPAGLPRALDLARCYWHCRWLGRTADWALLERVRWRFEELAGALTRIGAG